MLKYEGLLLGRDGNWQPTRVLEGQRHGKSVVARLEGVDDRDQAAALVGAEIGVSREHLPEPDDGQYYWSDLIGLEVVHLDGSVLGKLETLLETGAHDVMVVKGEQERLIPFVQDKIVISVDLAAARITVDWEWD